jgi:hypothetical protein
LTIEGDGVDEGYLRQELGPPTQWQVVQRQCEVTSRITVDLPGQKILAGGAVCDWGACSAVLITR